MQNEIAAARQGGRYYTLDGMRGVAAIVVAIFHYSHGLAPAGYLAVDLFFVMSGVVLAQAYTSRLQRGLRPLRFMVARYQRLYPLYFAGLIFGLVVTIFSPELPLRQAIASIPSGLLMVPAPLFHNGSLFPFNKPSWSLFYEVLINVWLAIALFRVSDRFLIGVQIISAVVLVLLAFKGYSLDLGARLNPIEVIGGLGRVCFSFSCGILIYRCGKESRRRVSIVSLGLIIATVLILVVPSGHRLIPSRDLVLSLVISPLLVSAATKVEPPLFIRRVFQFLGDISYPLYAVHLPTVLIWRAALPHSGLPQCIQIAVYVAGLLIVSAALVRWYDEPVRAWLAHLTRVQESAPSRFDTPGDQ